MKIKALELQLCKAWAREHADDDDILDVFHWKILETTREATVRTADFLTRQVNEEQSDLDALSASFYVEEEPGPNGDEDIEF